MMMGHDEARALLPQLAGGEIGKADERLLRRHLEECADCRSWLETWSLLADSLAPAEAEAGHLSSDQIARLAASRELLAESEPAALEEHLGECEDCRRLLELTREALTGGRKERRKPAVTSWLKPSRLALPMRVAAAAALVLALGLIFMPRRAPEVAGIADRNDREIADTVLRGTQVIEAEGSLTARGVTVESGGEVTLRASETVILENGFSVGSGASLTVVAGVSDVQPQAEAIADVS